MRYSLLFIVVLLYGSCGTADKPFVPNRDTDWMQDGLTGSVKTRTTRIYYLRDLKLTNKAKPVQKIVDSYGANGDKLNTVYYSTPLYKKLKNNTLVKAAKGDYFLFKESELNYSYDKRKDSFFISALYTNFIKPGSIKWEQEWIYTRFGIAIGESYYYEDKTGRESYFLEFYYNDKNQKVKEVYSGEYQGQPETYTRYINIDNMGRETNGIQVMGKVTNYSLISYHSNGTLQLKREVDSSRKLYAEERYNNSGHIIQRVIVDNKGKKAEYLYINETDNKGNIVRSWNKVSARYNRFTPELKPFSYQTVSYTYWSK